MANAMLDARHEGGSYRRIELITGERRRRQRMAKEKTRIVAESFEEGANFPRLPVATALPAGWSRRDVAVKDSAFQLAAASPRPSPASGGGGDPLRQVETPRSSSKARFIRTLYAGHDKALRPHHKAGRLFCSPHPQR